MTVALKSEGFGVLTEIDVETTLKKRLGVAFRRYGRVTSCRSAASSTRSSSRRWPRRSDASARVLEDENVAARVVRKVLTERQVLESLSA